MSGWLRVILLIAVILYFVLIVLFLKKGTLSLKYTLLWLGAGCVMAILVIFPGLLNVLVTLIDIQPPINGLFSFCIFLMIIIMMSLTAIVSRQNEKIKNLVQDNALMEKRIRELENLHQMEQSLNEEAAI